MPHHTSSNASASLRITPQRLPTPPHLYVGRRTERTYIMHTCDVCYKSFKRRDNMMRHKKHAHPESGEDEYMEQSASDPEDVLSDGEESYISDGDNEDQSSRGADPGNDPWYDIIDEAFIKCDEQYQKEVKRLMKKKNMSRKDAESQVYDDMRSTYRKAVMRLFIKKIEWLHSIRKDPIYKAIKKTASSLIQLDDYQPDEAWKSAVSQRKYLLDKLLKDYDPPSTDLGSDQESDQSNSDSESEEGDAEDDQGDHAEGATSSGYNTFTGLNPVVVPKLYGL